MKFRILFIGLSVWVGLAQAQNYVFGPNVRANSDSPGANGHQTRSPGQHLIAARGDTVYVVWMGQLAGIEHHIYLSRSHDGGQHFLPNVRVDNTISGCEGDAPSLAIDDSGTIHVCWLNHNPIPNYGAFTYYAKSTNGGQSFLPPVRACDSLYSSQFAHSSIAVSRDGRRVYVARSEGNYPQTLPYTVYLSRSTDGGSTFVRPDVRVNPIDTARAMHDPSVVAFDDTTVMITWDRGVVYFAKSVDAGGSFGPNLALSDSYPATADPSLGSDTLGHILVVWDGVNIVTSSDTGRTFSTARRLPGITGLYPSIWTARGGVSYLAWEWWRFADGDDEDVRFSYSTNCGDSFSSPVDPSDEPHTATMYFPTITANSAGSVFMAWGDNRNDLQGLNNDIYCATGVLAALQEKPAERGPDLLCEITPSPARTEVRIRLGLGGSGLVSVEVFDIKGRRIRSLQEGQLPGGMYRLEWDCRDDAGLRVRAGIYLVRIATQNGSQTEKIELVAD